MDMLNNVIGQERAKQMLLLLGQTFNRRQKLPPIGIYGSSGLGKTHLVTEFANWLNANLVYINGTAIKDPIAFRSIIKDAGKESDKYHLIFIDECHNLPKKIQENLLSVLEEPSILCTIAPTEMGNVRCVDGVKWIGKNDIMREQLPDNMSFIFATTDIVTLKDTIRNRLRKVQLEPYTISEKAEIAMTYLHNSGENPTTELCMALADRCRNIRHLKNDLCDTYIDIQHLFGDDPMEEKLAKLDEMLGLDEDGATYQDIDYLEYLAVNGIAGVETLAGVLKTDRKDVVLRIEPFLLEKGWIVVTGKGRKLTPLGRRKMGEVAPDALSDE